MHGPTPGLANRPGAKPDAAPPQMCFNSKVIQREVRQRSALLGKAIQAGVNRLQQLKRPELFAGVIAGSETMIGQDFKTGKYLGYRALLNRGFSREHPPQDLDLEREKVVQEFIELWTKGLAEAGVSPQKIYSHTAFFPRRAFKIGEQSRRPRIHSTIILRLRPWPSGNTIGLVSRPTRSRACSTTFTRNWPSTSRWAGHPARGRTCSSEAAPDNRA